MIQCALEMRSPESSDGQLNNGGERRQTGEVPFKVAGSHWRLAMPVPSPWLPYVCAFSRHGSTAVGGVQDQQVWRPTLLVSPNQCSWQT